MVKLRTNNILARNREGKKGIGLSLTYPSAEAIELVGMLGGFDHVNLDGEHGLFSPESIDAMARVANGYGLTVTARVPNLQSSTINLFLDRGVQGILGPHVETAAQAKQLVDACRFVPEGQPELGWRSRDVLQRRRPAGPARQPAHRVHGTGKPRDARHGAA